MISYCNTRERGYINWMGCACAVSDCICCYTGRSAICVCVMCLYTWCCGTHILPGATGVRETYDGCPSSPTGQGRAGNPSQMTTRHNHTTDNTQHHTPTSPTIHNMPHRQRQYITRHRHATHNTQHTTTPPTINNTPPRHRQYTTRHAHATDNTQHTNQQ